MKNKASELHLTTVPQSGPAQLLFSVNQAAAQLGISRSLFYNSIRTLGMRPIKVGRSARFEAAQIEEILAAAKRGDLRTKSPKKIQKAKRGG